MDTEDYWAGEPDMVRSWIPEER